MVEGLVVLYIFDLDGTLADISHRLHYISGSKKDWDSFNAACVNDTAIRQTVKILRALWDAGNDIRIWTGRSDKYRQVTERWLGENVPLCGYHLRMRKEGDHTEDWRLKKQWLCGLVGDTGLVPSEIAVFEDRSRVVQMWRDEGVTCYQVAKGDF